MIIWIGLRGVDNVNESARYVHAAYWSQPNNFGIWTWMYTWLLRGFFLGGVKIFIPHCLKIAEMFGFSTLFLLRKVVAPEKSRDWMPMNWITFSSTTGICTYLIQNKRGKCCISSNRCWVELQHRKRLRADIHVKSNKKRVGSRTNTSRLSVTVHRLYFIWYLKKPLCARRNLLCNAHCYWFFNDRSLE